MKLDTEFAFEGFRLLRSNPKLIVIWGLVRFAFTALVFWLMITMLGDTLRQLESYNKNPGGDPTAIFGTLAQMGPFYGLISLLGCVVGAVLLAANYRAVLGVHSEGLGYLRLGMDELRIAVVLFLTGIILILVYIALIIIGVITGTLVSQVGQPILTGIVAVLLVIGGLWELFYIMTRLSLNSVQSFDEGKINLFGSVALTKGHAGNLFLGYFIAVLLTIVVSLAVTLIYSAVAAVMGQSLLTVFTMTSPENLTTALLNQPHFWVYLLIVGGIGGAISTAIMYSTLPAAYKQLKAMKA